MRPRRQQDLGEKMNFKTLDQGKKRNHFEVGKNFEKDIVNGIVGLIMMAYFKNLDFDFAIACVPMIYSKELLNILARRIHENHGQHLDYYPKVYANKMLFKRKGKRTSVTCYQDKCESIKSSNVHVIRMPLKFDYGRLFILNKTERPTFEIEYPEVNVDDLFQENFVTIEDEEGNEIEFGYKLKSTNPPYELIVVACTMIENERNATLIPHDVIEKSKVQLSKQIIPPRHKLLELRDDIINKGRVFIGGQFDLNYEQPMGRIRDFHFEEKYSSGQEGCTGLVMKLEIAKTDIDLILFNLGKKSVYDLGYALTFVPIVSKYNHMEKMYYKIDGYRKVNLLVCNEPSFNGCVTLSASMGGKEIPRPKVGRGTFVPDIYQKFAYKGGYIKFDSSSEKWNPLTNLNRTFGKFIQT